MNWLTKGCSTVPVGKSYQVVTLKGLECVFESVLLVVVELAVLALFLMLIAGGIKYLISGGDSKAIESAQHLLTNAVLGIVIFAALWLLFLLIKTITGVDLGTFVIPK